MPREYRQYFDDHEYSGVNIAIIWDVITNHLPKLTKEVKSLLKKN